MKYLSVIIIGLILGGILVVGMLFFADHLSDESVCNFVSSSRDIPKPTYPIMEQYSFEKLQNKQVKTPKFRIGEKVQETKEIVSYIAYLETEIGTVSGMLNIPSESGTYPVILMFRGYVDQNIYETGIGTKHAGEVLAKNGFITYAPDFLGYGSSDMPSQVPLEERFQRYSTALSTISAVKNIEIALAVSDYPDVKVDTKHIGLWGHSNGGHIALSVLAITSEKYPTTLWAPVSKPFPYSILYYTDEFEDGGKALRKELADFEQRYDADKFSVTNYLSNIRAPIILHQGTADDAVPTSWSDELASSLKSMDVDVTYYKYEGDDHNFAQSSWKNVINRDIAFFREHFAD